MLFLICLLVANNLPEVPILPILKIIVPVQVVSNVVIWHDIFFLIFIILDFKMGLSYLVLFKSLFVVVYQLSYVNGRWKTERIIMIGVLTIVILWRLGRILDIINFHRFEIIKSKMQRWSLALRIKFTFIIIWIRKFWSRFSWIWRLVLWPWWLSCYYDPDD